VSYCFALSTPKPGIELRAHTGKFAINQSRESRDHFRFDEALSPQGGAAA
jgi:hypothetical protein